MGPWMSFYDLHDALEQADCPVCRLTAVAAERYLKSLLWEHVNDPGVRDQVRRAQGFCREHAWALARPGAWLGVAILMRDVLQSVLSTMDTAHFRALPSLSLRRAQEYLDPAQPSAATADLVRRLRAGAKCPACIQVERMEAIYVETLVKNLLGQHGLLAAYESSDGLCLPHFRQALVRVRDEAVFDALVRAQRHVWQRITGHLTEAIRKSDYRFRDEPWADARGAWLRGIAALSGARWAPTKTSGPLQDGETTVPPT